MNVFTLQLTGSPDDASHPQSPGCQFIHADDVAAVRVNNDGSIIVCGVAGSPGRDYAGHLHLRGEEAARFLQSFCPIIVSRVVPVADEPGQGSEAAQIDDVLRLRLTAARSLTLDRPLPALEPVAQASRLIPCEAFIWMELGSLAFNRTRVAHLKLEQDTCPAPGGDAGHVFEPPYLRVGFSPLPGPSVVLLDREVKAFLALFQSTGIALDGKPGFRGEDMAATFEKMEEREGNDAPAPIPPGPWVITS